MTTVRSGDSAAIAEAAVRLRAGRLVAFPTEPVYGLGAAALDPSAVERAFELKGRPRDNPLIVHVRDADAAAALAAPGAWDERAAELARRFWPGPLTLVLPKAPRIPDRVTAGRPSVALRSPDHPVAQDLLRAFGAPIAAPSANRTGRVSPTAADHVLAEFPDADLLVLDGGPCPVGIESTVLELGARGARLLRPGSVSAAAIESIVGPIDRPTLLAQDAAPGTRLRHYAPRTPARVLARPALMHRLAEPSRLYAVLLLEALPLPAPHRLIAMPAEPRAYARTLYAALRAADELGADEILVEAPPEARDAEDAALWTSIADRLRRATAR